MSIAVNCLCGATWTGTRIAHCRSADCHRTFSTARNFDRHWRGKGDNRHCVDPATVGLVPHEHPGCVIWSEPVREAAQRSESFRGTRRTDPPGSAALAVTPPTAIGIPASVVDP